MLDEKPVKWKVCLVGESAVGKTSLIRRFVFDQFDDSYSVTVGTKVTKKETRIRDPENDQFVNVILMIWDLMGQQCFLDLLKDSYFFGARGLIAMCDITRRNTLSELQRWVDVARSITEEIPMVILGNKCDLVSYQELDLDDLKRLASRYEKAEAYLSSVKTGFNVELAFKTLSERMLEDSID